MTANPLLSVVIVTYNEADQIETCIESVIEACGPVGEFEVIIVDGNSTDETVTIASKYPVTILQTDEDIRSTPSSGRYVGTAHANGDYVLYVDGDTAMAGDWLGDAIDRLESDSELAGVGGHFNDLEGSDEPEETDSLWRVALYEMDALDGVGGFDPYLNALEDIDLGVRLCRAGYRLERLPVVVGHHPELSGFDEWIRRWRQGFYYGQGEVIRKYLDQPRLLASWLKRLQLWFATIGWLLLGVGAAVVDEEFGLGWLVASILIVGLALVKRDRHWVAKKLGANLVLLPLGIARGIFRYQGSSDEYPVETAEVVYEPQDRTITT